MENFGNGAGIDSHRRKLIFALAGGDHRTLVLIHSLEKLKKREMVYRWFIRNKITGEKLYTFFEERRFSWLQVAKEVISRLEKQDASPIFVGKDLL
jgi:hypothetical protein